MQVAPSVSYSWAYLWIWLLVWVTLGPNLHMSLESCEVICIRTPRFLGRGHKEDLEQLTGMLLTFRAQLPKGRL